jgi:hypothetical protein
VRVYYFSPENGVYQGEGFEDKGQLDAVIGVTTVPPPVYGRGEVPVFDAMKQCWDIQQVAGKGQVYRE